MAIFLSSPEDCNFKLRKPSSSVTLTSTLGAYSVKTKKNQVDLFIADNNKISVNTMDNALDVGVITEQLSKLINDDVSSESRSDISDGNGETL